MAYLSPEVIWRYFSAVPLFLAEWEDDLEGVPDCLTLTPVGWCT